MLPCFENIAILLGTDELGAVFEGFKILQDGKQTYNTCRV